MSKLVTDLDYIDNYDEIREEDEMDNEEACETYELIKAFQEKYFYKINQSLGRKLKLLRIFNGLSLKEFAQKMHLSQQQIVKYENGTNSISPGRLMIICKILNSNPLEFYKELEPYNIDPSISHSAEPIVIGNQRMLADICLLFGKLQTHEQKGMHQLLKSLVEK